MNESPPVAASGPRLALLLLCHESPAVVARRLASPFFRHPDVTTYVHYDGARSAAQRAELQRLVPADARCVFVEEPVACRWGDHTLVEATRRLMACALADQAFGADHLVLLSASCVPYRPVASLQAYLRQRPGIEFIQAHDIRQGRWIKDGLESERYEFYFPFNYRSHRRWFEWATARQRELRVRRRLPEGLQVHFGSQWFCLTRATAAAVAAELDTPRIRRWLRWSWIPDEFAIQTLVAGICPPARVAGHNLTYYEFDSQGHPLVLDNGHFDHLMAQPFFFARKLAPEARALDEAVAQHVAQPEDDLAYFKDVGQATSAFSRHQAEVQSGLAARAHVGTIVDPWRGPMDSNTRRYYVLHATSRAWLLALMSAARGATRLPIFELPFERRHGVIDGQGGHLGLSARDFPRRDHDPLSFLLELVNVHPEQPCAFGLDLSRPSRIRDFVRWDRRAVLIDCNPPISREQHAATLLDELGEADDAPVIQGTLDAMRDGTVLPVAAFAKLLDEAGACQRVALRELGPALGDATLLALRTTYHALDPAPHHVEPGAAWRRFWK